MKHVSSFPKEGQEGWAELLSMHTRQSVSCMVRPMQIQIYIVPCHEVGHGMG